MRLEPLYRIRFTYPESWAVSLDGGWQQMFFIAEGRCEGSITGRFRGANFPQKAGSAGPFRPDFRAVIEADDGAVIMVEWSGYGRAYPADRRQVVGSVFHQADRDPYRRLNDVVCVCVGEVRAPEQPGQAGPDLVMDVAELIWEPIADLVSERVEDPDGDQLEIFDVAGDDGQVVHLRGGRDERVDHREGLRGLLAAPGGGDPEGDWENTVFESGLDVVEPLIEGGRLRPVAPGAHSGDPPADLPQRQHGDVQAVRWRGRDPAGHARSRPAFPRL
jgi:hypothetical protein